MTDADPAPGIQLEGDDIESQELGHEIRARSQARRAEAQAMGLDYEAYAGGLYPLPADAVFGRDLYEAVRQVGFGYDKVSVEMELTGTRLPVVGGLVQRLRAAVHELVLFYFNRLEARQMRFNKQMARAVAILVRDLEAEVRDLRARLADLETDRE